MYLNLLLVKFSVTSSVSLPNSSGSEESLFPLMLRTCKLLSDPISFGSSLIWLFSATLNSQHGALTCNECFQFPHLSNFYWKFGDHGVVNNEFLQRCEFANISGNRFQTTTIGVESHLSKLLLDRRYLQFG